MRKLIPLLVLLSVLVAPAAAEARHGLRTGFTDAASFQNPAAGERAAAFANMRAARGSVVRLTFNWSSVARSQPPDAASAVNPSWAGYDWRGVDAAVRSASAAGVRVLLSWTAAPRWAEGPGRPSSAPPGSWRPSPSAYRLFAQAAARRYSGAFNAGGGVLPRVRYWQAWNEPTLSDFITPQWRRTRRGLVPESPTTYRRLLNAFYDGVKAVNRGNYVVSAGTAPFGERRRGGRRMQAAFFTRELLCVSGRRRPRPKRCSSPRARFDALAHHPYPIGPPRRTARNADDVVIPDLGKLTRPLRVAIRAGKVFPRRSKGLWATEFSWDTRPPDPRGIPAGTQAQYVQGALYTLWRQGVSVAVWYLMRDEAPGQGYPFTLQAGVFFRGPSIAQDRPKPSFRSFRFPFTAYRRGRAAQLWGLAPRPGRVAIQVRRGGGWRTFLRPRARGDRLFFARRRVRRGALLRARQDGETSLTWRVGPAEKE